MQPATPKWALRIAVLTSSTILAALGLLPTSARGIPSDPPGSGEDHWADGFYAPGTGRDLNQDTQFILGGFESHGDIVAFGKFTVLDNQPIAHVARFDGVQWHPMQPGTVTPALRAVQDGEDVLVLFEDRSIRRWNGSGWAVEIPQAPAHVFAMAYWNAQVVVSIASETTPIPLVERWNGAAWEPLGSELTQGCVEGFANYRGNLVAWGAFHVDGAQPIANVAEWDGSGWKALAAGVAHPVVAAAVHDDHLFVISHELDEHMLRTPHLTSWDGQAWTAEDAVLPGGEFVPEILVSTGGRMIVSGIFSRDTGLFWVGRVDPPFRWAAAEYAAGHLGPLQEIRGGDARNFFAFGDRLVATGWFVSIGGSATHGIAALDASGEWLPLTGGNGVDAIWQDDVDPPAHPLQFVEFQGEWIAAGTFTSASGRAIGGIARYTAGGWQRLGDGVDATVSAVAVLDDKLYVAGTFEHAGGQPANGMAIWDGVSWTPFGNERIRGRVETIMKYQGQIMVGGDFFYIGPTLQAPNVARWNGMAWERMPANVFGPVHDLVDFGGSLLAGGDFNWNGRHSIGSVARWTGTEWATFGDQPLASVSHLRSFDGELVATTKARGENRRLVRWTGSGWTAIGQQPDADIQDFTSYRGALVGSFWWYEMVSANGYREYSRLYRLQGNDWLPLSRRLDADIRVLAPFGGSLYCAGPFTEVDGHRSAGVARWDGGPTGVVVQDFEAASGNAGIRLAWRVDPTAAASLVSVRIDRAVDSNGFAPLGVFAARSLEWGAGGYAWMDRDVSPGSIYAYRIGLQEARGEMTWAGPVTATGASVAFGIMPVAIPHRGGSVRIDYGIATAGDATLAVYDVRGRLVRQLASGHMMSGRHSAQWNRAGEGGSPVASGIYFVRLQAAARESVRRVVLAN
jgi:hypothetical protein